MIQLNDGSIFEVHSLPATFSCDAVQQGFVVVWHVDGVDMVRVDDDTIRITKMHASHGLIKAVVFAAGQDTPCAEMQINLVNQLPKFALYYVPAQKKPAAQQLTVASLGEVGAFGVIGGN